MKNKTLLSLLFSFIIGTLTFPIHIITGNAIQIALSQNILGILSKWVTTMLFTFMFAFTILSLLSNDSLQSKLQQMEKERSSSKESLEKPETGLSRRKWWGGKRTIEQIEQNPERYALETEEPTPNSWEEKRRIEGEYNRNKRNPSAEEDYSKARFELAKKNLKLSRPAFTKEEALMKEPYGKTYARHTKSSIESSYNDMEELYQKIGGGKNILFRDDKPISKTEIISKLKTFYAPFRKKNRKRNRRIPY